MSQNSSSQHSMIQNIQPAQATKLLEALKDELKKAKAAGPDTALARQHYTKAEQIKQVLVNYRQQQQQQRTVASRSATPAAAPAQAAPVGNAPNTSAVPNAGAVQTPQSFQARAPAPVGALPPAAAAAAAAAARPSAATVTPEKYNQVRARLQDLERKIQSLEAGRHPDITPEESTQIDNQLNEFRLKYGQYQKFAIYMRTQLIEQARLGLGTPGALPAAPAPGGPNLSANTPNTRTAPPTMGTTAPGLGANVQNVSGQVPPQPQPVLSAPAPAAAAASPTAQSGTDNVSAGSKTRGASPAKEGVPGVNLSGITKPSVPSMPILSTINVKPVNPITLKPGANNVRPTLTGGGATGLGQIMGSPAVVRMPTFDMASTSAGAIPDNGGRVLTKRKLSELVNTIGADEGDGKTTVDGDVEELLLDLADEFITSVTTFACRLAKHRKTDTVDVRDVQLHLERNWNIRVPGYAMDEIRGMRKWQPLSSYNQKVSGVEIAKAVNGNIN